MAGFSLRLFLAAIMCLAATVPAATQTPEQEEKFLAEAQPLIALFHRTHQTVLMIQDAEKLLPQDLEMSDEDVRNRERMQDMHAAFLRDHAEYVAAFERRAPVTDGLHERHARQIVRMRSVIEEFLQLIPEFAFEQQLHWELVEAEDVEALNLLGQKGFDRRLTLMKGLRETYLAQTEILPEENFVRLLVLTDVVIMDMDIASFEQVAAITDGAENETSRVHSSAYYDALERLADLLAKARRMLPFLEIQLQQFSDQDAIATYILLSKEAIDLRQDYLELSKEFAALNWTEDGRYANADPSEFVAIDQERLPIGQAMSQNGLRLNDIGIRLQNGTERR